MVNLLHEVWITYVDGLEVWSSLLHRPASYRQFLCPLYVGLRTSHGPD